MKQIKNRDFLTLKETADYTRLSEGTLYAFCSQRRIPYFKIGRRLLFNREDLDRWIDSHKVQARGDRLALGMA